MHVRHLYYVLGKNKASLSTEGGMWRFHMAVQMNHLEQLLKEIKEITAKKSAGVEDVSKSAVSQSISEGNEVRTVVQLRKTWRKTRCTRNAETTGDQNAMH